MRSFRTSDLCTRRQHSHAQVPSSVRNLHRKRRLHSTVNALAALCHRMISNVCIYVLYTAPLRARRQFAFGEPCTESFVACSFGGFPIYVYTPVAACNTYAFVPAELRLVFEEDLILLSQNGQLYSYTCGAPGISIKKTAIKNALFFYEKEEKRCS